MPTYDYFCPSNGQVLEVRHSMSERVGTWAELCQLAEVEPGDTALDAPVERLANGGQIVNRSSLGDKLSPCQTGAPCCGARACGLN
ncbi:hypothetical protein ADIMK_1219 [Marinobacterium lacunae]|uniref:Zinc ribbon domain-containing protein n=1 Tax=Marinobacterium lacunae TaxID=1232683 RepID=A0A081G1W1_9GAMM|nr:hypothetical protein [Marinobacterium lacunae]KEA64766.1 hypothetical protein ADIMK_1219 [Marinobacterium lacunae]MBR9883269.1 zinc ribbon domain-containing protein [Oceanospirillales bacterium]